MKARVFAGAAIMALCVELLASQTKSSTPPAAAGTREASQKAKERGVERLLREFDKNQDDLLDVSELPTALNKHFASLDTNEDGKVSQAELLTMQGRPGETVGEIITAAPREERYDDSLELGDPAPDFTLADPKGQRTVTLSSFQGMKPVVLIFGSYT